MMRMSGHIPARRYYISQHPQVEARLLEELRDLELMCGGAGKPRKLTPTDVQRLAYLHCVIKVCFICIYPCESALWSCAPQSALLIELLMLYLTAELLQQLQ